MNQINSNEPLNPILSTGLMATGGYAMHKSYDSVVGVKTLYHGTSKDNAEKIKKQGLLASKGGTGAASAIKDDGYIEASKNNIHVSSMKPMSAIYAHADMSAVPEWRDDPKSNRFIPPLKYKEGEVLKMKMPYGQYNSQFIHDEDGAPIRYGAAKTSKDVGLKNIRGSESYDGRAIYKNARSNMSSYMSNHTGRFARGVAGTIGGLAVMGYGAKETFFNG